MIQKSNVNIKKLNPDAIIPTYGTDYAAGADLYACLTEVVTVQPGQTYLVKTGIALEIPDGFAGLIYARSGLATKRGLAPANKVGVIDSDYRGELKVILFNVSNEPFVVKNGDRIAQAILCKVEKCNFELCDNLSSTIRQDKGFGSTKV